MLRWGGVRVWWKLGGGDSCWRCQLKPGVHTHTYKLMTGGAEVLKDVTALSGSVPPCPLLPTSSPLRHSEGMAHHARLTPEILSYRYRVSVWKRVCVIIRMRELLIQCPSNAHVFMCPWLFCVWGVTICVMELLTLRTWTRTIHRFLET